MKEPSTNGYPDLDVVNTALRLGADFLLPAGTVFKLEEVGFAPEGFGQVLYWGVQGKWCVFCYVELQQGCFVAREERLPGEPCRVSMLRKRVYARCEVVQLPRWAKPMSEWKQAG